MKIVHVVGARPNFMKAAPVLNAFAACPGVTQLLVHTGQHYDHNMSDIFFQQLGMKRPDLNLEVGSGTQAQQTAQVMVRFEEAVLREKPDWVVVYGDINSTVAATLVASKLGIKVAHVEAGLRSRDRRMPEELNRLVTDQLADLLLTPSADANVNLKREGIPASRIVLVGNIMIDTLVRLLPEARPPAGVTLAPKYMLVTLHRPSNVDDEAMLRRVAATLTKLTEQLQIIFPVHPRTRARLASFGIDLAANRNLVLLEPVGYLECVALQRGATVIATDSGGIQEESTYLGVPCLTVRENTERPVTVTEGTNTLVGQDLERLAAEVQAVLAGRGKTGHVPAFWDGHTGERIAAAITAPAAPAKRRARATR